MLRLFVASHNRDLLTTLCHSKLPDLNIVELTCFSLITPDNMCGSQAGLLLLVCLGSAAACHAPAARPLHSYARQALQEVAKPGHEPLASPATLDLDPLVALWHERSDLPGSQLRNAADAAPPAWKHKGTAGVQPGKGALTAAARLHRPPLREGWTPAQHSVHSVLGSNRHQRPQPAVTGRKLLQDWDNVWQPPGGLDATAIEQPFGGLLQEGPLPLPSILEPPGFLPDSLQGGGAPAGGQAGASIGASWGPPRLGTFFNRPLLLWIAGAAAGPLPAAPGPLPAAPDLAPAPAPQPAAAAPSSSGGGEAAAPVGAGAGCLHAGVLGGAMRAQTCSRHPGSICGAHHSHACSMVEHAAHGRGATSRLMEME